jgi:hypothetical protein
MKPLRAFTIVILVLCVACSSSSQRGIADKRSDFRKFLPMTGDPVRYGLKAVRPFFRTANRSEILHAIEAACSGEKEGSSVYRSEAQAGYYVNCNPSNRQLLNGYVARDARRRPSSHSTNP